MDNYAYIRTSYSATQPPLTSSAAVTPAMSRCSSCPYHQCNPTSQMYLTPAAVPTSSGCGCGRGVTIQPSPYHQNAVVVNQPVPQGDVITVATADSRRKWTSALCGCFENCNSCMCGFCCTPCFMWYVAEKLGEDGCGALCCCSFMVALRTKQRTAYDIKGSVFGDMCTTWFCPCCVVTQMYREYKNTKVAK